MSGRMERPSANSGFGVWVLNFCWKSMFGFRWMRGSADLVNHARAAMPSGTKPARNEATMKYTSGLGSDALILLSSGTLSTATAPVLSRSSRVRVAS